MNKKGLGTILMVIIGVVVLILGVGVGYFFVQQQSEMGQYDPAKPQIDEPTADMKVADLDIENPTISTEYNQGTEKTVSSVNGEVTSIDKNTFRELGNGWAVDKDHIFYNRELVQIENDIDMSSLVVLGDGNAIKDSKNVYFLNYQPEIKDYEIVGGYYGYELVSQPLIDVPTFQYIDDCGSAEGSYGKYFKDKSRIFVAGGYYTKRKVIFYDIESKDYIDTLSFQHLGTHFDQFSPYVVAYAKDKKSVYASCGEILKDADPSTFVDLGYGYAKDKHRAWFLGKVLAVTDVTTLQSLGLGYAKDKARAYFSGGSAKTDIDKEVDVDTLTVLTANAEYNTPNQNYDVFDVDSYAKDKNHVYHFGSIVEGVDPKDCTVEKIENCKPN